MAIFIGLLNVILTSEQFRASYFTLLLIMSCSPFSVSFEFQHNVCGRSIYTEGNIDAAIFGYFCNGTELRILLVSYPYFYNVGSIKGF